MEKCLVRKVGWQFFVDMHIEVDPQMTVENSHRISHEVKDKVRAEIPSVRDVLVHIAAHVRDDGFIVVGFGLDRGYALADFDSHAAIAGLELEHRFATWDLRPWRDDAPFAVTVLRRPKPNP